MMENVLNNVNNNVPVPPAPMKRKLQVLMEGKWEFIDREVDMPIPPAPKKGYNQRFVDSEWIFIKNPLNIKLKF